MPLAPGPARVLSDRAAVLEAARTAAVDLAAVAEARDACRRLPGPELDALSAAGLLAVTVPARWGGADVDWVTLAEVVRLLASGDSSVAQVPQSHFVYLDVLRRQGTPAQQERLFGEVLDGARFANAQTERGTARITEDRTSLDRTADGYLLTGEKYYCTGALFADRLAVRASLGDGSKAVAYVAVDTPGVTVVDDWDGMGQRTTASGTVRLDHVVVPVDLVVPYTPLFDGPTTFGAQAQLLHAAIDAGLAAAAVRESRAVVRKARPFFEAGVAHAVDDPLTVQQAGEVFVEVTAAESLLRDAARAVDRAREDPTDDSTARASVAVATAKVVCARAAVSAATVLFELGGTRSASGSLNLSRLWRDARTHTLHDPTRWKVQNLGRWVLSDTPPPRHGLL